MDDLLKEKISSLLHGCRDAEKTMTVLLDCYVAYNAAADLYKTYRDELATILNIEDVTHFADQIGHVTLSDEDGRAGAPGKNQILAALKKHGDGRDTNLALQAVLTIGGPKLLGQLVFEQVKQTIDELEQERKANTTKKLITQIGYHDPLPVPNKHHANIVLEVPHVVGIPKVVWFDFRAVKNTVEGRFVRFQYQSLFDTEPTANQTVRPGRNYEDVQGWVPKDHGVWLTNAGDPVITFRNQNRLATDENGSASRANITEEDIAEAQANKTYLPGEFCHRCYRFEGIEPGTFEYKDGQKWVPVRPTR